MASNPESAAPTPRRKPPVLVIALVAVAFVIGAVFGVRWWLHKQAFVETDDASVQGDIVAVSPRVSGHLAELAVEEGDTVEKGHLLFRLDEADFKAQLAQAEAALLVARTSLASSEGGVKVQADTTNAQLAQGEAAIQAARANAEKTRRDGERIESLFAAGGASRQTLDAARAATRAAEASLRQAEAAQAQARTGLEGVTIKQADVARTRAQIAQAEAAVEQARLNLAHARVEAPNDGIVVRRAANVGEQVSPGQAIVSLAKQAPIWVQAYIEETEIRRVHPGAEVEVGIDAFPGRKFEGHVESVNAVTGSQFSLMPQNNASGNFTKVVQRLPVRILVEDPEKRLRPGMSAVVEIKAGS